VRTIDQEAADRFLPPPGQTSRPLLDPEKPLQFGEVLFPDWYPDFEFKKHEALAGSLKVLTRVFDEFESLSGRRYAPVETYLCEDAELVFLGLGSMMHTARWTVARLRQQGAKVGVANLRVFRPFPEEEIARAVGKAKTVLVLDRDIGYGTSGMVYPDVTRTFYHREVRPEILNFIIGLGGKDITPKTIERCVELGRQGYRGKSVFWPDARGPEEGIPLSEALKLGDGRLAASSGGAFGAG
jgi:pyruvate ferredoxin oxidoreductase alpha subunit